MFFRAHSFRSSEPTKSSGRRPSFFVCSSKALTVGSAELGSCGAHQLGFPRGLDILELYHRTHLCAGRFWNEKGERWWLDGAGKGAAGNVILYRGAGAAKSMTKRLPGRPGQGLRLLSHSWCEPQSRGTSLHHQAYAPLGSGRPLPPSLCDSQL